jgi:hypothetical protein
MTTIDPLGELLTDLAERLAPHRIELIIGGGYGLLLFTRTITMR